MRTAFDSWARIESNDESSMLSNREEEAPPGRIPLAETYRLGSATRAAASPPRKLGPRALLGLRKDGYTIARRLVCAPLRDAALREINHRFGLARDERVHSGGVEEVMESPAVMDLLYATPAWSLAESLLGKGRIAPVTEAQAVLRFPRLGRTTWTPELHLDEYVPPYAGDATASVPSFSMLLCVLLSDLPTGSAGNFAFSPGSHLTVAAHLREHGTAALAPDLPLRLSLPPLVPFTGKAGDVAVCHALLAHDRQDNFSPHIRYAVFFRLMRADHRARRASALTDPWLEWPGLR